MNAFDSTTPAGGGPVAAAGYPPIAEPSWVPSVETLAMVVAAALALSASVAWLGGRADRRDRWRLILVARPLWTFAIAGAVLVTVALLTGRLAYARLLIAAYLACALLVAARLGWRVVAMSTQRDSPSRPGARGPRSTGTVSRREFAVDRAGDHVAEGIARERAVEPPHRARPSSDPEPGSGAGAEARSESAQLIRSLRAFMDEVSYAPGNPNVLSMTKYLDDASEERTAAARGEGVSARTAMPHEDRDGLTRSDDGDGSRPAERALRPR